MLLHRRHRQYALMGVFEVDPDFRRRDRARLHEKDAGNNRQGIGDAMLQLVEQQILLPQQLIAFALNDTPACPETR